jgi:hypothetical protein
MIAKAPVPAEGTERPMGSRHMLVTAIIALAIGVICFRAGVRDGGNADFYWKPMLLVWYATTALAFVMPKTASLARLRECWWAQLLVPVVLLVIACCLVGFYEPFPLV